MKRNDRDEIHRGMLIIAFVAAVIACFAIFVCWCACLEHDWGQARLSFAQASAATLLAFIFGVWIAPEVHRV